MRTRIELTTSGDIEMYDDVSTPLTFSIADIREPDKRTGSYSKTITVPGTKNNNLMFGNIFDVNVGDCTFNPKIKTPARLYIDDIPQLTGYLQLAKIRKTDNNKYEYDVVLFGKVKNIFLDIADDLLTDLDYSEFNHTYSRAVQQTSWSAAVGSGYVYGLIDYGHDSDTNKYDVEHLFPATYLKTYIDKIFSAKGYTYSSNFFTSDFFKHLVIPFNGTGLKLSQTQLEERRFVGFDNTVRNYTNQWIATQMLTINSESYDPLNQFGSNVCTIAEDGYYNFYGSIEYYLYSTSAMVSTNVQTILYLYKNGQVIGSAFQNKWFAPGGAGVDSSTGSIYLGVANILGEVGDVFDLRILTTDPYYRNNYSLKVTDVVFQNSAVDTNAIAGSAFDYNSAIPKNIKQKDVLKSVVSMFNLYIDVDKDNDKLMYIETRDSFYSSGTIIDWSNKLDISQSIEISPLVDVSNKKTTYTYKSDSDYYNKKYLDAHGENYGQYIYDSQNEFLANETKQEVIFSSTQLCSDVGNDRVTPRIWAVSDSNVITPKTSNIRLLYYGGLLPNTTQWNHSQRNLGTSFQNTYPFVGHVDTPYLPTLDLNFGIPKELYYRFEGANYYTTANVFNTYHSVMIDEINAKDSKIVSAYFHLTPYDITILDFRNRFFFDNQLYRLNKIIDYNPIINQLTKCEFIKVQ